MNLQAIRPNLPVALSFSLIPTLVSALPCRVAAGFPSPAEDHAVQRVDLMAQLIKHPQATFLLRVRGESMKDAGILTTMWCQWTVPLPRDLVTSSLPWWTASLSARPCGSDPVA